MYLLILYTDLIQFIKAQDQQKIAWNIGNKLRKRAMLSAGSNPGVLMTLSETVSKRASSSGPEMSCHLNLACHIILGCASLKICG